MGEGSVVTWPDTVADPPGMSASWPLMTTLPLGALPGATPCARLHARAVLTEWGLADLAEAAELIVSELVTNAVRHGSPDIVVALSVSAGRVRVAVQDGNDALPVVPSAPPSIDRPTGRGLLIVSATAADWGVEPIAGGPGKRVWVELATDGSRSPADG